jgi:hypothetical protein
VAWRYCSSIGGIRGSRGRAAYSTSKFDIIGAGRRRDYAGKAFASKPWARGNLGNTPMSKRVTKDDDPDTIKAFLAANRSAHPHGVGLECNN